MHLLAAMLWVSKQQVGGISKKDKKNPTVCIGKAFKNYQPLKHESIFLSVFRKDNELKVKLSNLLKTAFEKIKNSEDYKLKYIYSDHRMKQYFKSNFFLFLGENHCPVNL